MKLVFANFFSPLFSMPLIKKKNVDRFPFIKKKCITNLLQCATFPGIIHKFLDSLFASSKKKKLYLHVLTQLCFLFFIYNYSHQILLISYQLTFPFQTHLFSFSSPHSNIHNLLLIYCNDFSYQQRRQILFN